MKRTLFSPLFLFFVCLLLAVFVTNFAPQEKTLLANSRIVFFHGAWVWTAIICFYLAALVGFAGLLVRKERLHEWSRALGRTGLCFYITFLPMSLYVMQVTWNGLFLDEPRWRVPFNMALVGLLLQVGLSFFSRSAWTSLGNVLYGVALFLNMQMTGTVLHPVAPIENSGARGIQFFFGFLLIIMLTAAWQLVRVWIKLPLDKSNPSSYT